MDKPTVLTPSPAHEKRLPQDRESNNATPSSPKNPFKLARKIFFGVLGSLSLLLLIFIIYTAQDLPPLNEIENPQSSLSTQVLSADGMVLDNFYAKENRVNVRLNDISHYVIDALIATEDARFYEHSGVDYWSIPAVIKRNLTGTTSGGSTITMQLSRNLFNQVSAERTISRKIKEVIVSAILEKKYTKQEIIEAYLNTVNIFGNAYGIEMASQRLFGKRARDLELQEAAVLVGMLKGQGVYDPINKPDNVVKRRNLVINQMVKFGVLDTLELNVDSIKQLPLVTIKQGREHVQGLAPYFRQKVRDFMTEWCRNHTKADGTPYNLYSDGLKVYTTLDSRMQRHAEAAVQEHISKLQLDFDKHIKGREAYRYQKEILTDLMRQTRRYQLAKGEGMSESEIYEHFQEPVDMALFSWTGNIDTVLSPWDSIKYTCRFLETGFVSIDPSNGKVKAWVGGIDFQHFKYDHVIQGTRQVGSTFKPFVYGTALEAGYKPCDEAYNQPIVFENVDGDGTRWAPKNADGEHGGKMTLRSALATSTNLITAQLMHTVGPHSVVKFAKRMGVSTPLEAVPALCLGTADLSVMELTGAYATFANQGVFIEPIYVTHIEDNKGNVIAEFPQEVRRSLSPQNAFMMIELLKGVVDEPGGTASRLRNEYKFSNDIAGKTGTTQNHADGWFMGVTPNLVSGVWVGCADPRMRFSTITLGQGANMALPIWALYMQRLYADEAIKLPQERFTRPRGFYVNFNCGEEDEASASVQNPTQTQRRIPKSSDDFDSFD